LDLSVRAKIIFPARAGGKKIHPKTARKSIFDAVADQKFSAFSSRPRFHRSLRGKFIPSNLAISAASDIPIRLTWPGIASHERHNLNIKNA
jgi:hypothetical protein